MSEESNQNDSIKLEVKAIKPVFVQRYNTQTCMLCRNSLSEPCTICCVNPQDHCLVVEGECGHAFHKHCIDGWLRKESYCPGVQCNSFWIELGSYQVND